MDAAVPYLATLGAILLLLFPIALGLWVLRRQRKTFPEGFDRTGWSPEPGRARRFETMWTWLAGRGGPGP